MHPALKNTRADAVFIKSQNKSDFFVNSLLSDHMILPVSLVFGHVTITTSNMTFYDCGAVSQLNQSSQYVPTIHEVQYSSNQYS